MRRFCVEMYFSECMEQDKIGKCSLIAVQCFLIIRLFGDITEFERIFFQVIKDTGLHTAVDQKLVGIRTEHVADLRIRLAAKLQLGKSKLSVVVSKQRMSLHGRRDWLPAEFKDSRRYVDIFRKEGIRLSGGLLSGIFDKQGNFDERIGEPPKLESKGSG